MRTRSIVWSLLIWAIYLVPDVAMASDGVYTRDGVTLKVQSRGDHVEFCFTATPDRKISAEFGVEFKVGGDEAALWNESFPKVVRGEGWYFELPLRIELKARNASVTRHIGVDLGACSSAKLCTLINLDVVVPRQVADGAGLPCGPGQ